MVRHVVFAPQTSVSHTSPGLLSRWHLGRCCLTAGSTNEPLGLSRRTPIHLRTHTWSSKFKLINILMSLILDTQELQAFWTTRLLHARDDISSYSTYVPLYRTNKCKSFKFESRSQLVEDAPSGKRTQLVTFSVATSGALNLLLIQELGCFL